MKLEDFDTGRTYRIRTKDWESPTGEVVPGEEKLITILSRVSPENAPVDATPEEISSWAEFLRVRNEDRNRAILIHPDTIASAVVLL